MLLSSLLFKETKEWSLKMFAGCVVTLGGFALYSMAGVLAAWEQRREDGKSLGVREAGEGKGGAEGAAGGRGGARDEAEATGRQASLVSSRSKGGLGEQNV